MAQPRPNPGQARRAMRWSALLSSALFCVNYMQVVEMLVAKKKGKKGERGGDMGLRSVVWVRFANELSHGLLDVQVAPHAAGTM